MLDKDRTEIRRIVDRLLTACRKEERHIVAQSITGLPILIRDTLRATARVEQELLDAIEVIAARSYHGPVA